MSFSFIDIEQKKSKAIWGIFLFIICVYFLTIYFLLVVAENIVYLKLISSQYAMSRQLSWPVFPPFEHVLAVFLLAFVAAILHWAFSTDNLIFKLSFAAGAEKIDPKDIYHQHFKNIVDEVSIALGGRNIEPMIVCSASANAFALADFEGRAVIGVTEGLLARLNRAQIEAVVGHEAAHIASGDCLTTTITCSLGELYDEGIKRLSQTLENSQGRAGVYILLAWIVIAFTGFLSRLLRCFLSRERELRADAIAVRLTRDPLSLAEALKLISRNWRGAGTQGENLQSIFIVNPRAEAIDESE